MSGLLDDSFGDGLMSGTFRWTSAKVLPPLPPFPKPPLKVETMKGWGRFLETRDPSGSLTTIAKSDSSLLDGLTFPVTMAYVLQKFGGCRRELEEEEEEEEAGDDHQCKRDGTRGRNAGDNETGLGEATGRKKLNLIVLGASKKAEERILWDTKYWQEVAYLFPHHDLHLFLIGPEISSTKSPQEIKRRVDMPSNFTVELLRLQPPCASKFLSQHPELDSANSMFFTFNGGFGSFVETGDMQLLKSWYPDLLRVSESGMKAAFTCANDYIDVVGEMRVHEEMIKSRIVAVPQLNPYHSGSTFVGEAGKEGSWFSGNYCFYVIQGRERSDDREERNEEDREGEEAESGHCLGAKGQDGGGSQRQGGETELNKSNEESGKEEEEQETGGKDKEIVDGGTEGSEEVGVEEVEEVANVDSIVDYEFQHEVLEGGEQVLIIVIRFNEDTSMQHLDLQVPPPRP
ncbi:hypothetical protein GUITHDRAFT_108696 [Guillardia theta CCMP2712]|uniref:Mitochondrial splicing suppressor 51-like C-terminal domain-containing protein n=1 Tax=Guillardia theta (strain CCMP2712) TaxID=905079 RepID=L1JBD3_GUITC|nr:hypothetical protein GUITHDRAFT_108696 [Guillardia theta CCMP2712]EKX45429.1 hypothetical protein GUITHDRAFT_108696 [Guillardia theta CCMP2712]|eukprot:XP_005832409.1 hypothetical protein GUITHDRAFT_108696 [Guillardia theta CCMP2712]